MIEYKSSFKSRKLLQISAQIKIKIPPNKIWGIITEPGHLKNYHPFCDYHEQSKWDGIGSKDRSKSYAGKIINREIIAWQEGVSYQIKMNNNDTHDTHVKFDVIESNNMTFFKITITTNAYRNMPRPLWCFLSHLMIVPSYKKYFHSQLNGLKYFCETGKKVRRNQFGNHKKYSP
jgi:hypothetical protein